MKHTDVSLLSKIAAEVPKPFADLLSASYDKVKVRSPTRSWEPKERSSKKSGSGERKRRSDVQRDIPKKYKLDNIDAKKTILNETIDPNIEYNPLEVPDQDAVPRLEHKLSRVLFSPGVHYLQDPRTGVFNFNPYIQDITPVEKFDFNAITTFVTASKDEILTKLTKENGLRYYASTSSMTGVLSHMHFLFSNFRPASLVDFSRQQRGVRGTMTLGARTPASVIMRKQGGVYAVDSDKSADRDIVLSLLGQSLERFLTKTPEDYEQYLTSQAHTRTEKIQESNTYHYAKMGPFLMRSQLDCQDPRLPGTGTFDLKTRAVAAVRHDLAKVERDATGYAIVKTTGQFESYEKELLDLAKSTMLKYSLQARIGNMDGIFIAYHNIAQMFGFQYLPLSHIDEMMHSSGMKDVDYMESWDKPEVIHRAQMRTELCTKMAEEEFKMSVKLWEKILEKVTKEFPDDSFRLIMNAEQVSDYETKLSVVSTSISDAEIDNIQSAGERLQKLMIDATDEEHQKIVEQHIGKIEKTNTSIRHDPYGFDVYIKHFVNGWAQTRHRHVTFKSLNDEWETAIKFVESNQNEAISVYDTCLKTKTSMLGNSSVAQADENASDLIKVLRMLGRFREEKKQPKGLVVWNQD